MTGFSYRRRLLLSLVATAVATVGVVGLTVPGAMGAYVAAVSNSSDSVSMNPYFTCQAAEQGDATTTAIFEYALSDSSGSSTASDTSVNTVKQNGTYASAGVTHGVANGAPAVCARDRTTVAAFTGYSLAGGGYVSGPATRTAAPATFSIEVWFKSSTASGRLIGFGDSATGGSLNDDRHLYIGANGTLAFGINAPGAGLKTVTSTVAVTDGTWHDAVATFSPTAGMALYLDGTLQSTNSAVTTAAAYNGYWHLGNDSLLLWPGATVINGGFFTGNMAFAAAYSTVLTPALVAAHYRAGV